jgi:hypothetical protein
VGKCLDRDAVVITEQGLVTAADLCAAEERPSILTFDQESRRLHATAMYDIWSNDVKPVFALTTKTGRLILAISPATIRP